jgi:hypothetical protein
VPLSLTPRLMQEQKIRFVATVAAPISPYSELPYLQLTLISSTLSGSWTQVCEDPMLFSLNEPSRGTARRHKKSQVEARALICVVETDDAGGAVATLGTEADQNSKLKAPVDQQLATFKMYALPVPTKWRREASTIA